MVSAAEADFADLVPLLFGEPEQQTSGCDVEALDQIVAPVRRPQRAKSNAKVSLVVYV